MFGNIVTMRWWEDLWLNESFAEFACNWAASEATRYPDAWARHLAGQKLEAYLADQGPVSHPIRQPIRDVAQAMSIFDAITYPKGASVLRQLQVFVGEQAFRTGMAPTSPVSPGRTPRCRIWSTNWPQPAART